MEQKIFTVLGLLDEYGGRKIAKCKDEVECFYPGEKAVADFFESCIRSLINECKLQTQIKREVKETGHIYFYSHKLNDLICSYYIKNNLTDLESTEIPKYIDEKGFLHYATGKIGEGIFPVKNHSRKLSAEDRNSRLSFLIGVYARYGRDNQFCFGNAYHKARLVEELLIQLGSDWLRFTRNYECAPYLHEIEFKVTEEMKRHFVSYKDA